MQAKKVRPQVILHKLNNVRTTTLGLSFDFVEVNLQSVSGSLVSCFGDPVNVLAKQNGNKDEEAEEEVQSVEQSLLFHTYYHTFDY